MTVCMTWKWRSRSLLPLVLVGVLLPRYDADAQEVRFERILQIGEEMGSAAYSFGFVVDVMVGPDSLIYVLDSRNGEVRVFDPSGHHLRSMGRLGEGPGEFLMANRMLLKQGRILVSDARLQRLVAFSLDGRHLETTRIEPPTPAEWFVPLRDSLWLAGRAAISGKGLPELARAPAGRVSAVAAEFRSESAYRFVVFRGGSARVDTLLTYDHGRIMRVRPQGQFGPVPGTRGPGAVWAASGDSMVAILDTYQGEFRVVKAENGRMATVRRGRIPVTPLPLTDRDWRLVAAESNFRLDAGDRLTGPPFASLFSNMLFAPDGSLWIIRREAASSAPPVRRRVLVVPPEGGGAQHYVDIPEGLAILRVDADVLIGIRRTPLDTQIVELWRIVTNGR